jgi:hypothetical protein
MKKYYDSEYIEGEGPIIYLGPNREYELLEEIKSKDEVIEAYMKALDKSHSSTDFWFNIATMLGVLCVVLIFLLVIT